MIPVNMIPITHPITLVTKLQLRVSSECLAENSKTTTYENLAYDVQEEHGMLESKQLLFKNYIMKTKCLYLIYNK